MSNHSGLQEARLWPFIVPLDRKRMKLGSILFISFLGEAVAYKPPLSPQRASHQQVPLVSWPQNMNCYLEFGAEAWTKVQPSQKKTNVIFYVISYQKSLQREVLTTRLDWIKGATSAMVFSLALGVSPSRAALQGLSLRPPEGNCNGCLGVINGLLAPCDTVSPGRG